MNEWWYNDQTGRLHQQTSAFIEPQGKKWHGPFRSKEEAVAFYNGQKAAHPDWKPPVMPSTQVRDTLTDFTTPGIVQGVKDFPDILNPAKNVNLQSWLIRIGEILLGIVLIGVGLAKLTGTTNQIASIVKARIP